MKKKPGCQHQWDSEPNCAPLFHNFYECEDCGIAWDSEWSCACNDKCSGCNHEIEPFKSDEVEPCACECL